MLPTGSYSQFLTSGEDQIVEQSTGLREISQFSEKVINQSKSKVNQSESLSFMGGLRIFANQTGHAQVMIFVDHHPNLTSTHCVLTLTPI